MTGSAAALFNTQAWAEFGPTPTDAKLPLGGAVRALLLIPQQWIVPVLRKAQLWKPPALIWM